MSWSRRTKSNSTSTRSTTFKNLCLEYKILCYIIYRLRALPALSIFNSPMFLLEKTVGGLRSWQPNFGVAKSTACRRNVRDFIFRANVEQRESWNTYINKKKVMDLIEATKKAVGPYLNSFLGHSLKRYHNLNLMVLTLKANNSCSSHCFTFRFEL